MEIILLISVTIVTFVGWALTLKDDAYSESYESRSLISGLLCIVCPFFIICGFIVYYNTIPKAIDVYRGKTTLEITYRDSIPVDSVVVFK